jgi:hypothetical protein
VIANTERKEDASYLVSKEAENNFNFLEENLD